MRISDWSSDVCSSDLTSSSQFIRCIDDSFRECDRYLARTVRNTRLDLDEILWRLGFLDTLDRPHYVALLENILANENLRQAYVACWKAAKDAFGCDMTEPAEYSRLVRSEERRVGKGGFS